MKNLWKTIRLGVYFFALPLVATAAASAHSWMTDSKPLDLVDTNVAVATLDASQIGTLRSHTLAMDEDGAIRGRIVNIDKASSSAAGLGSLKVYFARNGEVAQQVFTDADGTFTVDGLAPGIYSFVAAGETGFAAYGVNVVEAGAGQFPNIMEAAAVSPRFVAVKEILESSVGTEVAEAIAATASDATSNHVAGSNRVKLVDGDLLGNVIPMIGSRDAAAGTFVHIISNDEEVATVEVDGNGSFRIQDLDPGVYDFVAAGPSGFAAVGFEAVQDEVAAGIDSEMIETAIPDSASIAESVMDVDASFVDATPAPVAQDFISADVPMDGGFVDGGFADGGFGGGGYYDPSMSLDVPMTAPMDNYLVGDSVGYACDTCGGAPVSDGYVTSPIEYAGESVGCGAAAGGTCGGCNNFGGFSNCCAPRGNSCCGGGGFGGRLMGGGGFRRIARIALLAWAITEIAQDDDGADGPISPVNPS